MRQVSFPFFIFLMVLSFCSCQKEIPDYASGGNTDSTASDTSSRVKRYVEDLYDTSASSQHSIDSALLTYDNQGRIITFTTVTSGGTKLVFAYNGSQSFTMDEYTGNTITFHEDFFVVNGRVDSTIQYSSGDTSTEKYAYNSAKQVTKLYEYDYTKAGGSVLYNTTTYSYDANGDQNSFTDNTSTTRYTYTTNTINNIDDGFIYFSSPKHLPDTETFIEAGVSTKGTHTYAHDSRGRVTVDKLVADDGTILERRYYY